MVKMVNHRFNRDAKISILTIDHAGHILGCQWPWSNFLTIDHGSNSRVSWLLVSEESQQMKNRSHAIYMKNVNGVVYLN